MKRCSCDGLANGSLLDDAGAHSNGAPSHWRRGPLKYPDRLPDLGPLAIVYF